MTVQSKGLVPNHVMPSKNPAAFATLVQRAGTSDTSGDRMQICSAPEQPVRKPNFQAETLSIDTKQMARSLKKMTLGALAGAATFGASIPFCGLGMLLSHTDGQENAVFGWGGLALGATVGVTAAVCGAPIWASVMAAGAVGQGIMSLGDWFGR